MQQKIDTWEMESTRTSTEDAFTPPLLETRGLFGGGLWGSSDTTQLLKDHLSETKSARGMSLLSTNSADDLFPLTEFSLVAHAERQKSGFAIGSVWDGSEAARQSSTLANHVQQSPQKGSDSPLSAPAAAASPGAAASKALVAAKKLRPPAHSESFLLDMQTLEDSSFEDIVVKSCKAILSETSRPHLKAVELANFLRARVGFDVLARIRERWGGLLSLLERHPTRFRVDRIPKNDIVTLLKGGRDSPSSPADSMPVIGAQAQDLSLSPSAIHQTLPSASSLPQQQHLQQQQLQPASLRELLSSSVVLDAELRSLTLLVGNLPAGSNDAQLFEEFDRYGEVVELKSFHEPPGASSAFVRFATIEQSVAALQRISKVAKYCGKVTFAHVLSPQQQLIRLQQQQQQQEEAARAQQQTLQMAFDYSALQQQLLQQRQQQQRQQQQLQQQQQQIMMQDARFDLSALTDSLMGVGAEAAGSGGRGRGPPPGMHGSVSAPDISAVSSDLGFPFSSPSQAQRPIGFAGLGVSPQQFTQIDTTLLRLTDPAFTQSDVWVPDAKNDSPYLVVVLNELHSLKVCSVAHLSLVVPNHTGRDVNPLALRAMLLSWPSQVTVKGFNVTLPGHANSLLANRSTSWF
jgi:hypothetical protein